MAPEPASPSPATTAPPHSRPGCATERPLTAPASAGVPIRAPQRAAAPADLLWDGQFLAPRALQAATRLAHGQAPPHAQSRQCVRRLVTIVAADIAPEQMFYAHGLTYAYLFSR